MNSRHPNIKFTFELEQNDTFSFLDIKISRDQSDSFSTSVFRKPTFSGVFTYFSSYMPKTYKLGLVYTMIFVVLTSVPPTKIFTKKYLNLKKLLKRMAILPDFIDFRIKKFLNKLYTKKQVYLTAEKKRLLIVLPFLGSLSFKIRKRLTSCLKNIFRPANL